MSKRKKFLAFLVFALLILLTLKFLIKKEIKEPIFRRVDNIQILNNSYNSIVLNADLVFYNPNKKDALLLNTFLKIFSKNEQIGTVSSQEVTRLNANSEVFIPTLITLDLDKIKSSQNLAELLETVLNADTDLELTFKGDVNIVVDKFNFNIPINHKKSIKI